MMETGSMSDGPAGPVGVVWSVKTDHNPDWESLAPYIGKVRQTPMPARISMSYFQVKYQTDSRRNSKSAKASRPFGSLRVKIRRRGWNQLSVSLVPDACLRPRRTDVSFTYPDAPVRHCPMSTPAFWIWFILATPGIHRLAIVKEPGSGREAMPLKLNDWHGTYRARRLSFRPPAPRPTTASL
jgi:hypothetical protein